MIKALGKRVITSAYKGFPLAAEGRSIEEFLRVKAESPYLWLSISHGGSA